MPRRKNKKSPAQSIDEIPSPTSSQVSLTAGSPGGRETTRSKIATEFVRGFGIVIILALIVGWIKGYTVNEIKDTLLAISGILSGPLGFIIGFYFKESLTDKE